MKNLVLSLMIMVFGLFACSQAKPPKAVSDALKNQFAKAEKVQWGQEEENEWEAEFMMDGKEMSACYDIAGKWIETESALSTDELPPAITDSLKVKFEDFEIEEAESIEKPGFKGFEITLEKDSTAMEVLIDVNGEITSKNMIEQEEEEEEEGDD